MHPTMQDCTFLGKRLCSCLTKLIPIAPDSAQRLFLMALGICNTSRTGMTQILRMDNYNFCCCMKLSKLASENRNHRFWSPRNLA